MLYFVLEAFRKDLVSLVDKVNQNFVFNLILFDFVTLYLIQS